MDPFQVPPTTDASICIIGKGTQANSSLFNQLINLRTKTAEWQRGWHFMLSLPPKAHQVILNKQVLYPRETVQGYCALRKCEEISHLGEYNYSDLYTSTLCDHFSF